ncbi:MAG: SUMF1/EgtB/PvdO family nonheme iron enzyme [Verrucomicrobiaceae bacterium]
MPSDPFLNQSQDRGGPAMPSLVEGQFLFNRRYELVHKLGAGGMGVVWLARDHTEHTEVALKFLPTVLVQHEGEMKRLRDEVRAGKELRHPGIVATYGMEVEDSTAAIVMEYVPGQTLKELLEENERGFFEPEEITGCAHTIAEAIDYLHTKAKRVHRDIKPANIIVDAEGEARLMDFGISSRIQDGLTRHSKTSEGHGSSSSTLAYASPQQLEGRAAAPADDLYSFGATLYELLTGTPPFYRGDAHVVGYQIATQPVMPIMTRRAELVAEGANAGIGETVSPSIERAVLACLAKTREERPANAASVVQRLNAPTSSKRSMAASPPPVSTGVSRFWPVFGSLLLLAVAGWGWKTLFPPDNRHDQLPSSPEDLKEAAMKQVLKEQTEKESKAATAPTPLKSQATTPGEANTQPANATKDKPFINSLGMKFVPVPIGAGPSKDQRILFSIWETRSRDYAAFVTDSRHGVDEEWKTGSYHGVPVGRGEGERAEDSNHPVAFVSRDDAVAFCTWLTKKDRAIGVIGPQDEYRLPTNMEWSYAVGIGDREDASAAEKGVFMENVYPWGTAFPPPAGSGNYADTTAEAKHTLRGNSIEGYTDGYATTAPVGSFKANALGLHDLGGNLWEWVGVLGVDRVNQNVRGASWGENSGNWLSSSVRAGQNYLYGGDQTGFRCVLVVGAAVTASQNVESPPTLTATKEAPFTNSLGMKFVPVPINAGPSKGQRILFSIWETRSKDYAAFVKDSGHDAGEDWKTFSFKDVPVGRGEGEKAEDSNHPVTFVNHDDAVAFCAWLTKKDRSSGLIGPQDEYRLPSDVEWSYAVGIGDKEDASASPKDKDGGVQDLYYRGTTFPPPPGSGNYADTAAKTKGTDLSGSIEGYTDGYATTAPVGSFKANALGLHDLGGNLAERIGSDNLMGSSTHGMIGSTWVSADAGLTLSAYLTAADHRFGNVGFRCVLVVGGESAPKSGTAPTSAPDARSAAPAKPATATKEAPFTNSLGMKFVPVPINAGPSKGQRIFFSIWETRSKDYAAFVKDSGHDAGEDWKTGSYKEVPVGRGEGESAEQSNHPVAFVNHDDAVAFCAWLTKNDRASGLIGSQDEYRLPSDVEWSYAVGIGDREDARASPKDKNEGVKDAYPWGTAFPPPTVIGNYADTTAKVKANDILGIIQGYTDDFVTTAPVGSFKANELGLQDMGGNVWEWTGSAGDDSGSRVLRGASWFISDASVTLSSARSTYAAATRNLNFGFRCVLAVSTGANTSPNSESPTQLAMTATPSVSSTPLDSGAVGKQHEVTLPGGVKLALCFCPAGSFTMGSPASEEGHTDDEEQVKVTLTQPFWLARTEFTQAQWRAVMGTDPSHFKGDDQPVESVSAEDADACIVKLNEKVPLKGWKWALPTEAQWEYACRAGTTTPFHFGSIAKGKEANWNGNLRFGSSVGLPLDKTSPVGKYAANAWGLCDMHGNVSEWCPDMWDGRAKLSGGLDPLRIAEGIRVIRGGSWNENAQLCRSARRYYAYSGSEHIGFRPALVPARSD